MYFKILFTKLEFTILNIDVTTSCFDGIVIKNLGLKTISYIK